MKIILHRLLIGLVLLQLESSLSAALPPADPPYFRVHYEASTLPGNLALGVSYTVWIPTRVKTLRGVIVHQHGCGQGACQGAETAAFDLHWQALAQKYQCALLGPSYEQPDQADCSLWCDPRKGSNQTFLQALHELGAQSGHPELATVPWALWGHSGGANWAGTMLLMHPERIIAVWLRSGSPRLVSLRDQKSPLEIPPLAYEVPVVCNLGIKEHNDRFAQLWKSTVEFFHEFRGKGALISVAIDPISSHDCGHSRYLAVPWMDTCLAARLPRQPGAALKRMPTQGAWLAHLFSDRAEPASQFRGDPTAASWFPNRRVAKRWEEYTKNGDVIDLSPPPTPTQLRVSASGDLTWNVEADFESGLSGFIILRDGVEIARLPMQPIGTIGRPLFQGMTYHDTPMNPVPRMQFSDQTAQPGKKHRYCIRAVNSVGLKSKSSANVSTP